MKSRSENYDIKMADQCRARSHLKVTLISSGQSFIFSDEEISSATKTNEVDPLSRRVPKETFNFSIFDYQNEYNPSNPKGKWSSMDENAKIKVEYGFEVSSGVTEWLEADYYYLDAKPTVSGGIATFKASSRLCHLTKTYYKGIYADSNLYDLAVAVLTDAGVSSSDYFIDSSLTTMTTNAPLPVISHINCLQLIAHAARCTLKTVNGMIRIEPFNLTITPSNFIIGLDSIALNGDIISKIETLYKVEANLYVYTPDTDTSELSTFVIDVDGETECHIEYSASCEQEITVEGSATISNINTYASAADFILSGSGTFTIKVSGKKINTSISTTESIVSLNTNGSTDTEKNQLITTATLQYALIYHVANYLQFRLTHTVKYRGNPELEALDAIYFATVYGTYISALVLNHTITFNGAISGSLTLKSLSEINDTYLYDSTPELVIDSLDDRVSLIGLIDYESAYSTEDMNDFIKEVIE